MAIQHLFYILLKFHFVPFTCTFCSFELSILFLSVLHQAKHGCTLLKKQTDKLKENLESTTRADDKTTVKQLQEKLVSEEQVLSECYMFTYPAVGTAHDGPSESCKHAGMMPVALQLEVC